MKKFSAYWLIVTLVLLMSPSVPLAADVVAKVCQRVPNPIDTPGAGTYSSTQTVTLSDASFTGAGLFICYTTDGSVPWYNGTSCGNGTHYTTTISVAATETIKYIACGTNYSCSALQSSLYTISSSAPAFVQQKDCKWFGASGTSEACAFTSNPTATNGIVVFISWGTNTSNITTVQDAASASYSNTAWISGANNCKTNGTNTLVYSLVNSAGGANAKTITVTWGVDPGFGVISMFELSGANTSAMIDKADCVSQTVTTSPASPSVTPSIQSAILGFGFDQGGNGRTWTAGTSPAFTLTGTSNSWFGQEYFIETSAAATTGNFTINSNSNTNTAVVAVKP